MQAKVLLCVASLVLGTAFGVGCGDDDDHEADAGHQHGDGDSGDGDSGDGDSGDGDSGDGDSGDGDAPGPVTEVRFEAVVAAQAFACDEVFEGLGTSDATIAPLDFRFYVHDVRLVGEDGDVPFVLEDSEWQTGGVALLDFEDAGGSCKNGTAQTNKVLKGEAPAGVYTGIKFKVGLPEDLNHKDPASAPSPLNLTALHWNWNGGYKFMRLDMMVLLDEDNDAGMSSVPYNFHLGSTMCKGDAPTGETVSCSHPNRPEIALSLDPASDRIKVDYAALVEDADLLADQGEGPPGCMSFPGDADCPAIFKQLGLDYDSGDQLDVQALFHP